MPLEILNIILIASCVCTPKVCLSIYMCTSVQHRARGLVKDRQPLIRGVVGWFHNIETVFLFLKTILLLCNLFKHCGGNRVSDLDFIL